MSPTDTIRSRPGQATVGEPSPGTTAMGARAPNRARSDAYRSTSTSEVMNRVPPSSIWYELSPRQASTMDGAARAATSSTVPGPVTWATAAPTAALASCTTTRMSGRSSLIRRAVSRVWTSVRSAHTTARASASPARWSTPAIRGLPTMKGMSQASTIRTRRASGSSSTTTTTTPAWWSCSTIRRPTPWRQSPSPYGAPPAFLPDCRSVSGRWTRFRAGAPVPGPVPTAGRRRVIRAGEARRGPRPGTPTRGAGRGIHVRFSC